MPIIGRIKGIILRMFFSDHAPPHFHATNNNEDEGLFKIKDLEMFKGDLKSKDQREVKKWAKPRQNKLKDMWDSQDIHNLD